MLEISDGDSLDPLIYGAVIGECTETRRVVFHYVDIEFVYQLIVIHIKREDPPDDAVHQRAALHEEKLPGDLFVTGDKPFYDLLVCHLSIMIRVLP